MRATTVRMPPSLHRAASCLVRSPLGPQHPRGSQEPACPADLTSREAHDSLLVTLFQKIHKAAFAMVRAADLTEREVREKEDEAAELRALELQTRCVSPLLARQRTRSAPETLFEVSGARCRSTLVFMMDPLPPQGACRDV